MTKQGAPPSLYQYLDHPAPKLFANSSEAHDAKKPDKNYSDVAVTGQICGVAGLCSIR